MEEEEGEEGEVEGERGAGADFMIVEDSSDSDGEDSLEVRPLLLLYRYQLTMDGVLH